MGNTFTRAELYKLVWAAPLNKVAERLGISGQRLGQICDQHHIARPAQGHWTRLELGKPVEVRALQPPPAGVAETITLISKPPSPRRMSGAQSAPTTAGPVGVAPQVADRLVRPHSLVAEWIAVREGEVRAKAQVYDHRLKRVVWPVPLTPADRRRLLLADAIFKAVERRGVVVKKGERRELVMALGGENIAFQIRYRLKRGRRSLTADELRWRGPDAQNWANEFYETDALIFEIKTWLPRGFQTEWEDSKRGTIEEQLAEIIDGIMATFPALEELRRQREEQKRQHEREARERQQSEDERKLDRARFRRLLEHVGQWREAELARAFLAALREAMPSDAPAVAGIETAEWLAWAERKVEDHDRLASDPLSVLESIADVTSRTYRDA